MLACCVGGAGLHRRLARCIVRAMQSRGLRPAGQLPVLFSADPAVPTDLPARPLAAVAQDVPHPAHLLRQRCVRARVRARACAFDSVCARARAAGLIETILHATSLDRLKKSAVRLFIAAAPGRARPRCALRARACGLRTGGCRYRVPAWLPRAPGVAAKAPGVAATGTGRGCHGHWA